jgi:hypothetical protein
MEEAPASTDTIWPLQDEGDLTANAMSYVDDYLQAIEFEQCFDSALLGSDVPYPDLYGATVDWETVLQRKYAPAIRREQFTSSPCFYTTPSAAGMFPP